MDLVTYLRGVDQEDYQEQLNQTLRFNLGNNGFLLPNVTAAGVTQITGMNYVPVLPVGTTWFRHWCWCAASDYDGCRSWHE